MPEPRTRSGAGFFLSGQVPGEVDFAEGAGAPPAVPLHDDQPATGVHLLQVPQVEVAPFGVSGERGQPGVTECFSGLRVQFGYVVVAAGAEVVGVDDLVCEGCA